MRGTTRAVALGAALLMTVGVTALPAAAQNGVVCDDVFVGQTIRGPLVVPEEATCVVEDVVVVGDVHVGLMADLFAFDLTVTGDVLIDPDAYVDLEESVVEGDIDGDVAFGASLVASELGGDLTTRLALLALVLDSDIGGGVEMVGSTRGNTEVLFDTARIAGDVHIDRPQLADAFNSTLEGDFEVRRSLDGSVVCTSEVDGDATFAAGRGTLDIGPGNACETNYFGGDLNVNDHAGTPVIEGNIVRGDLNCEGNTEIFGGDNRVRGAATGQCEDLQPAPSTFGAASADTAEDRRSQVLELRESRRDAGAELGTASSSAESDELIDERRDEIAELRGGETPAASRDLAVDRVRAGRG